MSGLSEAVRRFFGRFGRPDTITVRSEITLTSDAHDEQVDSRLTDLEAKNLEIKARLRILEKAGNPRGIGRE